MFLKLLDRATAKGENVSATPTANNYAPTKFAKMAEAKDAHFGRDDFAEALERHLEGFRIAVEEYGPPSRRAHRIARTALASPPGPQETEDAAAAVVTAHQHVRLI